MEETIIKDTTSVHYMKQRKHLHKLFIRIITFKLTNKWASYRFREQASYRRVSNIMDHLHTMRILVENGNEYKHNTLDSNDVLKKSLQPPRIMDSTKCLK